MSDLYGAASGVILDFQELQLKWAVEAIADEVGELMDYLERREDLEGFEHFSKVIAAINRYNRLTAPLMRENN